MKDESKLPAWARKELARLRDEAAYYAGLAAKQDAGETRVTIGLREIPASYRHLRDDLPITFTFANGARLCVKLSDDQRSIEVYAPSGRLSVAPHSRNVVSIESPEEA